MGITLNVEEVKLRFNERGCKLLSQEYIDAKTPLLYICKCGTERKLSLNKFQEKGNSCRECGKVKNAIKKSLEVQKYLERYGSKLIEINEVKITYLCNCGKYSSSHVNHFKKYKKCKHCVENIRSRTKKKKSKSPANKTPYSKISELILEHGCELLTNEANYLNTSSPIEIMCSCGKVKKTTYKNFMRSKYNCDDCFRESLKLDLATVRDYYRKNGATLLSDKINSSDPLLFKCRCGSISSKLWTTFKRSGCCNECAISLSKGEEEITHLLIKRQVNFVRQHRFSEDDGICNKPFDFIIKNELLIEFDGEQHFKPVDYFGGKDKFTRQGITDKIKNQYCIDNNIPLIRIPYWEFKNIEYILENVLKRYNLIDSDGSYDKDIVLKYLVDENWDHDEYIAMGNKSKKEKKGDESVGA